MRPQLRGSWHPAGLLAGWRGLGRFWGATAVLLAIGAAVLQTLGVPPDRPRAPASEPLATGKATAARDNPPAASTTRQVTTAPPPALSLRPGRSTPGPVADPDPALLEPYPGNPDLRLPRKGAGGRAPMSVYAAGFDPSSLRPRVGLLIAGIGMSEADSLMAIKNLPGGVTLAISPYATDVHHILALIRMTEHEYLLSLPMEPQGYPANDPDDRRALMTSQPPAENLNRLRAVLAGISGYVGVTDALGQMHGERLAGAPEQFDSVLQEVADRGLLFVDARTGKPNLPYAWNRSADLTIDDDPPDAATLDQRLDTLIRIARDKGSALGIVSLPRPVTIERITAWTNTLASKGLALAPVSALVGPPAGQETGK